MTPANCEYIAARGRNGINETNPGIWQGKEEKTIMQAKLQIMKMQLPMCIHACA